MKIREAEQKDIPTIQKIFVKTIKKSCTKEYTPSQIETWTSAADNYESWAQRIKNQYFLVAEVNDKIVGFGSLEKNSYIDLMYVEFHHQRKGIAQALYKALEKKAQTLRSQKLNSDVSLTAIPFFKKMGFTELKKNELTINTVKITNVSMEKPLIKTS